MKTNMEITGRPGQWYITNYETGENAGPYSTREEVIAKLNTLSVNKNKNEDEKIFMRLIVERSENGRIKEVKVLKE